VVWAVTFPLLVKGGLGGGAGDLSYPRVACNAVRKRRAKQGGEAARVPSTSSIDRAKHASLVHSTPTVPPPCPPPHKGGKVKHNRATVDDDEVAISPPSQGGESQTR
jgi:hypothetical protein